MVLKSHRPVNYLFVNKLPTSVNALSDSVPVALNNYSLINTAFVSMRVFKLLFAYSNYNCLCMPNDNLTIST